ncbi:hypothetical protein [Haliangium sp.]|uniref:hypothetical protein n=1 Tax=Haliangium sp. TaxID=2663208 RepID=UPI003D13B62F
MDTLIHALRSAFEYLLKPFDALPPFWGLTLVSIVSGVFMLWVVGKTTPQRRIEVARARMASAIYEIRLFLDSPKRIVLSQGRLLAWSFAYVGYMLPAFFLLSLPLGPLYLHLETRHGLAPLPVGAPIVVTVTMEPGRDLGAVAVGDLPEGVRVTAPAVRVPDEDRVYLRLVIDQPGTYELPIRVGDAVVEKRLAADPAAAAAGAPMFPERTRGGALLASFGHEDPVPADLGVAAIAVTHPESIRSYLGMSGPWWAAYWLIVATIAALALRRPMGVTL